MKTNLTDITFLLLVRLDSVQRLENTLVVARSLLKYFNTNIHVLEADSYNSGILERLLDRRINYRFVEDKDPVLHKTKYYNLMVADVNTTYMAIWDTDIVVDNKTINQAVEILRNHADAVLPYNGKCYDVPDVIKRLYFKTKDVRILKRHEDKMNLLYEQMLVGGAVFVKREKYLEAGGDNEEIYGWGNDDFTRFMRFKAHGYNLRRTDNALFHLCHPRGINSRYRNEFSKKTSVAELSKGMRGDALFNPNEAHT